MMEDSDILTLGWGCEAPPSSHLWHPGSGEEFVTLEEPNQLDCFYKAFFYNLNLKCFVINAYMLI